MLKKSTLCMIIAFIILALLSVNVDAVFIESEETLKAAFEGTNATIEGTTITLTGDVEIKMEGWVEGSEGTGIDNLDFCGGDYTLNLNGHKLTAFEIYINEGSLIVNDTTGEGEIESQAEFFNVAEGSKLTFNNGITAHLANDGETIINNGNIGFIQNNGTITIENGNFDAIGQNGNATINGGTFTASKSGDFEKFSAFALDYGSTVITGGEFKKDETIDFSVVVNSSIPFEEKAINELMGIGFEGSFNEFKYQMDGPYPPDDSYFYTGFYDSIKVVSAKDNFSELFKKITDDETWELEVLKPTNFDDAMFLLEALANDALNTNGTYASVGVQDDHNGFDPEIARIYVSHPDGKSEIHRVRIKYLNPTEEKVTTVNGVLDKMKNWKTKEDITTQNAYRLEDLYLINYLYSNAGAKINSNHSLNFVKELREATNGANISYGFDIRMGGGGILYSEVLGRAIIYHAGEAFTTRNMGLVVNRVMYVPQDTLNTPEAYAEAAIKRIKEYLGEDVNISVSVGGTLESLNEDGMTYNQDGLIDETTCGTHYYNIKVNGNTYTFAICKKDVEKLETPKYIGSNIESNIKITSDDTKIPLDTEVSVKNVTSDNIKNVLGTDEYAAFDISLYSSTKEASIKEGNFKVSIPVPNSLKGKKLVAYFIKDDNSTEEYEVTIENENAIFDVNHFSTYILAEKIEKTNEGEAGMGESQPGGAQLGEPQPEEPKLEDKGPKDETPKTGEINIINYLWIVTLVSGIGLVFLKKKK